MNKNKRILTAFFLAAIILIISFPQFSGQLPENIVNKKINDVTNSGTLEIIDISFEGMKIIATIKSIDADYRTIWVYFYKSRIINGNPTVPILIGNNFASIRPGQTIFVPKIWLGFGHYIIYVKIFNHTDSSQEVLWFLFNGKEVN